MDRNIPNTFIFKTDDSDGMTVEHWCFCGAIHVQVRQNLDEVVEQGYPVREIYEGEVRTCDGSCRCFDVRAAIGRIKLEDLHEEDGSVLPSVLEISPEAQVMLNSDRFMRGQMFDSWYAKRDSQGYEVCLGDVHVTVCHVDSWARGERLNKTHTVKVEPCNGRCKTVPVGVDDEFVSRLQELCQKFEDGELPKKQPCDGDW